MAEVDVVSEKAEAVVAAETCPVCMEELDRLQTIQFGCTHRYCSACALRWLNDDHDTCPMCVQTVVDRTQGVLRVGSPLRRLRDTLSVVFGPVTNFLLVIANTYLNFFIFFCKFLTFVADKLPWICITLVLLWSALVARDLGVSRAGAGNLTTGGAGGDQIPLNTLRDVVQILSALIHNATRITQHAVTALETKFNATSYHATLDTVDLLFHFIELVVQNVLVFTKLVVYSFVTLQWPSILPAGPRA